MPVRNVSFHLSAGKTLGIVGESGSGKTLTALSLLGLLPRNAHATGEIKTGERTYALGQRPPIRTAMIFQDAATALNPTMRCGLQIAEALVDKTLQRAAQAAQVMDLLRAVQLPDPARIFQAYPHELSGGQQQRIVLAIALAAQPQLLIADEPTTALDRPLQQQLIYMLKTLQQAQGWAMLFISHDFSIVAELADTLLVMRQGEVVEQNDAATLLARPSHAYTKALLACQPSATVRYKRLPTLADFAENADFIPSTVSESAQKNRQQALYRSTPLVRLTHEGRRYRKRGPFWQPTTWTEALQPGTIEIFEGEALGIVGPSGSGKTTLGRLLEKYALPNTQKYGPPAVVRIAQNPYATLQPRLSVGAAIEEPIRVHRLAANRKAARARVEALLEAVGLTTAHYDRLPHTLSGGQRQRVSIARALAVQPRLLICDEVTSALDVSVQAAVVNLLLDLRTQFGLTYVFIAHDEALVFQCCDRVLRLEAGHVVSNQCT